MNNDIKVGSDSAFAEGSDGTAITAEDSAGDMATASDNHVIKATFTVAPESPNPGEDITIILLDTDVESDSSVKVAFAGGEAMDANEADDDADATWKITLPSDVRTGTIQVSVTVDSAAALTKNLTIATNDLEVTPTDVVPGQQITVTGSGFTSSDKTDTDTAENTIDENTVTVGGVDSEHDILLIDNNGRISFNINIPEGVPTGEQKVVVRDLGGHIGNGTVTVAKPALTLNPTQG